MDGGTGAGPHMWNIVENDDKYYMADITNCDEGTVGENGGLFLDTPISGSVSKGYTYAIESTDMHYAYDTETKTLYGNRKEFGSSDDTGCLFCRWINCETCENIDYRHIKCDSR